jgi:drug/metabolite transporter (DMT)-like permease
MLAWGVAHSSASNGAILSLTIPLLMTVMGAVMLGERITRLRLTTLALGLAGTLLVSLNDLKSASFSRNLFFGNLVIFLAGAGSAFYNAYGKDLLTRFTEIEVLVYSYVSGGLFCALISLFESRPFYLLNGYSWGVWGAVAILGLLSWGVAMLIWMWVLTRLDVGQISVSVYLLPFFGLLLSVFTLHERLDVLQLLGGGVVVVSTVVLTAFDKPQALPSEPFIAG